jgi:hypothetical protein
MAANIITVKQTITTVRIVEALPVDTATEAEIDAFLAGTGYNYAAYSQDMLAALSNMVGAVMKSGDAKMGDDFVVSPGDFLVKVDGTPEQPCDPRTFTERYNK